MDSGDGRSAATFHFVVKNFTNSVTTNNMFSLPCMIRNIPWKICIKKSDNSQPKQLGIYLHCFAESDCVCHQDWNCRAKVKFSILHRNSSNDNDCDYVDSESDFIFHSGASGWGKTAFIAWNRVTDSRNGYITDNTVIIRAEVAVGTPVGITFKTKDDDNASKLLESEKKIQSLESELKLLKNDLVNEKKKLQSLKNDVANGKTDAQSKMKILETIVTNVVLQISELKKVKGPVAQNGSNNSSTEDMRSELKDALLSLLGVKSE